MPEILKLIYSIALPCWAGYQLLTFILREQPLPVSCALAISFGLGFGLLTQGMLVLDALGFEYTVVRITALLIVLGICFWILSQRDKTPCPHSKPSLSAKPIPRLNAASFFLVTLTWALIVYYFATCFWGALSIPVYTWDSIATCIYNAKIIYFDRSLTSFLSFSHPAYPLHVSMITSWISYNLGHWDDQLFKVYFPLTLTAFVIVYHAFLASKTNKKWALVGVLLLLSSNLLVHHSTVAYRDLPLMYYNCLTIIFLLIWKDQAQDTFLILASLFSGLGTFIKQEGTAYLLVHVLVMLFILIRYKGGETKGKAKQALKFLLPSLGILSLFYLYKIASGVSATEYLDVRLGAAIQRIPFSTECFRKALFHTANWNILWAFLFVSVLLNLKKALLDPTISTLLIAIILFLGLHFSLSIIIGNEFIIHPFDISRVILHFFPLCPLAIILIISPEKSP